MVAAITRPYDDCDISSLAFWSSDADTREEAFARLRRDRPISWHAPAEGGILPPAEGDGFWAAVTHRDVVAISRTPEVFTSGPGVMLEDIPEDLAEAAHSFLALDAPRHTKLRRLVSSAFTPRRVALISDQIRAQARATVDDLISTGPGDFVRLVSRRLPMWTIAEMVGVDPAQQDRFALTANSMVGWNDPTVLDGRNPLDLLLESLFELHGMALAMADERRNAPADDLMTALVQAEVDGDRLTDLEIASFFVLLAVAGNDTTRNTISHGMRALTQFPGQREVLLADVEGRIGPAVDEMIRWASPVMTFRRNAAVDTELSGVPIAAGDKVVMFYASANRDEKVFDRPYEFDVTRTPNDHVGFGGGGPHFCLGASLARTQLRSIFSELLNRVPDLTVGEPDLLAGNFIHGITAMPCDF